MSKVLGGGSGGLLRVRAGIEVVLSLGAVNTPKRLMQSGIGDEAELQRLGIDLVQHLPGVGQNFQDHVRMFGCVLRVGVPAGGSAPQRELGSAAMEEPFRTGRARHADPAIR
jgi:choline dehydrogenase-like flavoprotein